MATGKPHRRGWLLLGVVSVVLAGVVAYGISAYGRAAASRPDAGRTDVLTTELKALEDEPRLVFRSTAPGDEYGKVAVVPLDDPSGPRAFADVTCDRVAATPEAVSCLRTVRGIVTQYEAQVLDAAWQPVASWPLPGLPSRTRLSPGATRVATTSFVTGHTYASTGFSTETTVRAIAGGPADNIEEYALVRDGEEIAPVDRNLWGVTWLDEDAFYATAQSRTLGQTWLVRGSVSTRRLEVVREGVECPSLSPDGSLIAFKKDVGDGDQPFWAPAVLDLSTGSERVLESEERTVDDQIAWLDDGTILYGMPVGSPGTELEFAL